MNIIPYEVKHESIDELKTELLFGTVGLNFENENDIFASIYSTNSTIRTEAKIFIKLLPQLKKSTKIVYYGLNKDKKEKIMDKLQDKSFFKMAATAHAKHNNLLTKIPHLITKATLNGSAKFGIDLIKNKMQETHADILLVPYYLL